MRRGFFIAEREKVYLDFSTWAVPHTRPHLISFVHRVMFTMKLMLIGFADLDFDAINHIFHKKNLRQRGDKFSYDFILF